MPMFLCAVARSVLCSCVFASRQAGQTIHHLRQVAKKNSRGSHRALRSCWFLPETNLLAVPRFGERRALHNFKSFAGEQASQVIDAPPPETRIRVRTFRLGFA